MSTKLLFSTSSSTTTARRVARAAMIVMVGGLLSGVVGLLVRQAEITPSFGLRFDVPGIIQLMGLFSGQVGLPPRELIGAGIGVIDQDELVIYLITFSLPVLIFNLMTSGVLASAFLPTFISFVAREEHENGWRLASAVANWLGIVSLLVAIFMPWVVRYVIAPDLPPESMQLSPLWMLLIFVSTAIFSLSGLMMSILNAYEHFLMPAIAPVIYYIAIFFSAFVLTSYLGFLGLPLGVALGALGVALVQLPKLRQFGAHYTPTLGWRDPVIWGSVRHVAKLLVPSLLGTAVMPLMLIANTIIASIYHPLLSQILTFAQTILLPTGFFASSIAIAIFPTFSRMAAKNNKAGMRQALAQTLRCLLFVAMPLAVGVVMLRMPINYLLFESGEFSGTIKVAWALGCYGLAIIPYFLIEVIHRAYFAIQDTLRPVLIAAAAMIVHIALSLMLVSSRGALAALPLANTIAATTQVLLLLWVLSHKIGGIEARALLSSSVRLAIAAGVGLYAMLQVLALISQPILMLLAIPIGGTIYFATAWLLGVEETRLVLRMILPQR